MVNLVKMRPLDEKIEDIKEIIRGMGDLVRENLSKALECIKDLNLERVDKVVALDQKVNNFYFKGKKRIIECIALYQPVATDLRFLSASIDVLKDIERIGDYSVDIAKAARYIEHGLKWKHIFEAGELAKDIVKLSINSYVNLEHSRMKDILRLEDRIDFIYRNMFSELKREPVENVSDILNAILISRYLERIGDHSINISERMIYVLEGKREYM